MQNTNNIKRRNRPVTILIFVAVLFCAGGSGRDFDAELWAAENVPVAKNDERAVADAKRGLGQSTVGVKKFPWYSSETDGAAFVPFPKEREDKPRVERETRSPREPGAFWGFFATMSYWTLLGIGLIVLAFILVLAWYVLYRNKDLFRKLWKKEEYKERLRRIETLPEEARDMFDDLIGAATRAFEAGQYRNALIYYFSHQLVWLDMHELIRMHKGKTNHEYARELKQATEVLPYYESSMALFESVYYGDHPITRLLFLGIWEHRHDFSRAVKEEKRRRDENRQQRFNGAGSFNGAGAAALRDSLTLTVDLPESRPLASQHIDAEVIDESAEKTDDGNHFRPSGGLMLLVLTCGLLFGTVGCWREPVQTTYVPPPGYDKSLNGITVFNDMTMRRGHALRTGMGLNSYAKNGDVLVWFARRTGCPQEETVKQVEDWLAAKPGRTFVYVGRAFESTYDYWSAVEPLAPTDADRQKIAAEKLKAGNELRALLAKPDDKKPDDKKTEQVEKSEVKESPGKTFFLFDEDDSRIGKNTTCSWFDASRSERQCKVTAISGDGNWTKDVAADKLQLTCYEDWDFADDVEPLLIADGETVVPTGESQSVEGRTLVARKKVGESQAVFVTNAGFLLNYPLVNHEHRKLSGRLLDMFGSQKKRAYVYIGFSEINFEKSNDVSDESPHVLLTLLHIWPISVILFHLIVLCTTFCFYKWPIFGRPRRVAEPSVTDFGKHIDAYAELLAEAKDDDYAIRQITDAYNTHKHDLS